MKKIIITFAATSVAYAALVFGLLHFEVYYLLSQTDMHTVQEQFEQVYNEGYKFFQLYHLCKNAS